MISKKTFIRLAEAYINENAYLDEVYGVMRTAGEKYLPSTDFLGLPEFSSATAEAILHVLGEDFSYWYYDCEQSFSKFNKNITLKDGSHPKVKNLGQLYNFAIEEESVRDD